MWFWYYPGLWREWHLLNPQASSIETFIENKRLRYKNTKGLGLKCGMNGMFKNLKITTIKKKKPWVRAHHLHWAELRGTEIIREYMLLYFSKGQHSYVWILQMLFFPSMHLIVLRIVPFWMQLWISGFEISYKTKINKINQ